MAAQPSPVFASAARQRQQQLTKPPGALGRLEAIAVQLAALQQRHNPQLERVHITIFAADHGVAGEGVSAFPQAVTAEMVRNFSRGGAAICVAARQLQATLEVVNLGTVQALEALEGVKSQRIAAGTANFCQTEAMNLAALQSALEAGEAVVSAARQADVDIFIPGEMGIANTTAAAALAAALLGEPVATLVGAGTGVTVAGVAHKAAVIERAFVRHAAVVNAGEPLALLQTFGGFEIIAMVGAMIAASQQRLPILVDGFIASVAALYATRLCAGAQQWLFFAHTSAEAGHRRVLQVLGAEALLDLQMRLGEGSGAAVALPLLRMACALHNQMATFAAAGVSEKRE
ncbi:MAG: nicotinate-nucleotide--dimethylbenzimidazole phosphoribosyltransferase [Gammaproteobacteria bacterium]|nr:nicotinate-nucleotide--dimethylbenzimidazole phosphoribosyltransferase [Gammaproteobacteria bacterium]